MPLSEYIINDIKPLQTSDSVKDVQQLFNQLTYSHIPIIRDNIYIGCMSGNDAHCFESNKNITDFLFI